MKNGRKAFVYVILFIVFVAQIAFTRPNQTDATVTNAKEEATVIKSSMVSNTMGESSEAIQNAVAQLSDSNAEAEGSDKTEKTEETLELNVVYKDKLTSMGPIMDDLKDEQITGYFANRVISYCEDRISIYSQPDTTSDVVGCMYSRTQAKVLEKGEEFSYISSGDVEGYVLNTYLLFGEEAEKVAPFIGSKSTVVGEADINIYSAADINSDIIGNFYAGQDINAYDETNGWILVDCDYGFGYVREEGILESYDIPFAMSIEEEQAYLAEQARIEAERLAAEREAQARAAAALNTNIGVSTNPAMSVEWNEEYLLACIIEWEAGWEPYEGKLAVANVVLNRVRSPRFAQNTITAVIYAPGQFSGVLDGNGNISERFGNLLAAGPSHDDCYSAAAEALAGVNNIGDYLFFISAKKANFARYTQYTILNNHCFYAY